MKRFKGKKFNDNKNGNQVRQYLSQKEKLVKMDENLFKNLHIFLPVPLFIYKLFIFRKFLNPVANKEKFKENMDKIESFEKLKSNGYVINTVYEAFKGGIVYVPIVVTAIISLFTKVLDMQLLDKLLKTAVDFPKDVLNIEVEKKEEGFQTMSKIDRDFVEIFKRKNKNNKLIHKLNEIFPLNHDKYSTVLQYSLINDKINL